ncbi:TlpA family protein disulfide reductase [Chitinophaga agrisoli]|uniref:TlpA family protein disulfide reductase n=1 Tax=Chitinophaga agrisoli TaxID=2607653 RepID=A0A5B2VWC7_9BACT|nr:TlpA disulfide reductase family protein [Chitinophaga agrisoli]KAA2242612.1 TlpA family protein disulfide reductase [Chitinophaga agrisoli]
MNKQYGLLALCLVFFLQLSAQGLQPGKWRAVLHRADGHHIPFELDIQQQQQQYTVFIVNGKERVNAGKASLRQDSLIFSLPVFESDFKARIISRDSISGVWISGGPNGDVLLPFTAVAGQARFRAAAASKPAAIQGKWRFTFTRANQTKRQAIGQFAQQGAAVSGSVLTPAADYRYLNGIITNDSLFLSTFDGAHAILLAARLHPDSLNGVYYAGTAATERWTAVKTDSVTLTAAVTKVKEGSDGKVDFNFRDLDGHPVSLQSERYKGKVVILQLMGSWCPNCMDETAFLSEYYAKNKQRGVEIIALAYEQSTDSIRSHNSLRKFQTRFNVQYPMLNTGVAVGDPQRTEKTLPQLTEIKVFPTSVILDKNGVVREVETTFYGPGAGEYHQRFKAKFEKTVDELLEEQ